jgi:hypothetical protein
LLICSKEKGMMLWRRLKVFIRLWPILLQIYCRSLKDIERKLLMQGGYRILISMPKSSFKTILLHPILLLSRDNPSPK